MVISKIKEQARRKGRFDVFIDGEYAASLNLETLAARNIKQGGEICALELEEAVREDNDAFAFELSLSYLGFARRSEREVEKYLAARKVDGGSIERAIFKLKDYGYVDDEALSADFVEEAARNGKSRRYMEQKLRQKGVDAFIIEDALLSYGEEDELENAVKQAAAALRGMNVDDMRKAKQKAYNRLIAHGFDFDTAKRAVERALEEEA